MLTPALNSYSPRLSVLAVAVEQGEQREPGRAVDDALALELVGDAAAVFLADDVDDLVLRQRSGLARLHHQPGDRADRHARRRPGETSGRRSPPTAATAWAFSASSAAADRRSRPAAALLARRNRLARARGGSPPLVGGALMPSVGLPLAAALVELHGARGLSESPARPRRRLYMTERLDETSIYRPEAAHAAARKIIDAFVPPKPNEFDSATSIGRLRAAFGARSIAVSTDGLSRLRVGGAT